MICDAPPNGSSIWWPRNGTFLLLAQKNRLSAGPPFGRTAPLSPLRLLSFLLGIVKTRWGPWRPPCKTQRYWLEIPIRTLLQYPKDTNGAQQCRISAADWSAACDRSYRPLREGTVEQLAGVSPNFVQKWMGDLNSLLYRAEGGWRYSCLAYVNFRYLYQ